MKKVNLSFLADELEENFDGWKQFYFRHQAFYEICRNWCEENDIPYFDDQN